MENPCSLSCGVFLFEWVKHNKIIVTITTLIAIYIKNFHSATNCFSQSRFMPNNIFDLYQITNILTLREDIYEKNSYHFVIAVYYQLWNSIRCYKTA